MQNFDPKELEKFEKMAASWWDPEGDFKPIHQLNPLRLDYIQQQANGLLGKRVLDIGCGGGILAESMAEQGALVTGIDMSSAPLEVARQHSHQNGLVIDYQQATIEQFCQLQKKLRTEKFDLICCMEMLEHVPEPNSVIQACKSLLKPDGRLFLSTINRSLKAWGLVILGAEYLLRLLPQGTHNYEKFIKPAELLAWTDKAELECLNICGYHYNPLTGRFWLNHDVSSNYMATFKHR